MPKKIIFIIFLIIDIIFIVFVTDFTYDRWQNHKISKMLPAKIDNYEIEYREVYGSYFKDFKSAYIRYGPLPPELQETVGYISIEIIKHPSLGEAKKRIELLTRLYSTDPKKIYINGMEINTGFKSATIESEPEPKFPDLNFIWREDDYTSRIWVVGVGKNYSKEKNYQEALKIANIINQ